MEDFISKGWVVPRQSAPGFTQLRHREPVHTHMYGIEIIQSNEYFRESETEEVVIFR